MKRLHDRNAHRLRASSVNPRGVRDGVGIEARQSGFELSLPLRTGDPTIGYSWRVRESEQTIDPYIREFGNHDFCFRLLGMKRSVDHQLLVDSPRKR